MKILVRATNWVGDAVMSIPALWAIRGRWPNAEIVILARPWVADLYRGQGYADRILIYENQGKHKGFWGRERLARALRLEKFDVAVLFQRFAWRNLMWPCFSRTPSTQPGSLGARGYPSASAMRGTREAGY